MGDDNDTTRLGRFLTKLPVGPKWRERIEAGDFIADKIVGVLDKDGKGIDLSDDVSNEDKKTIVDAILAGPEALLDKHDFEDLTERENQLVDEIAMRLVELGLLVGIRKGFQKD